MLLRVLRHPVSRIILGLAALAFASGGAQALAHLLHMPKPGPALLTTTAVFFVYVSFVRGLERRAVTELRLNAVPLVLVGFVLGAALFCATLGVLVRLGVAHMSEGDGWRSALFAVPVALAIAVTEELMIRGVVFRICEASLGTWIALAISAALFGALHAFNDGATVVNTIAIACEAGVLLAAAYVVTRGLWLPIGLHLGWNFTEGDIFGAAVSGHSAHGVWHSAFTGAPLLSGGAFGPEASLVAVVVCTVAGALLLWRGAKLGHFVTLQRTFKYPQA